MSSPEEILNATVVIDEEAPDFVFREFMKKVDYVLELNEAPLVMTSKRRRQLKNHLEVELSRRHLPPDFEQRLHALGNLRNGLQIPTRRTAGKRRHKKTNKKKLK
jgi:hypothetical protein